MFIKKFFISFLSCLVLTLVIFLVKPNKIVLGLTCTGGEYHKLTDCRGDIYAGCTGKSDPHYNVCAPRDGVCKQPVPNQICGWNSSIGGCDIIWGTPNWTYIPCADSGCDENSWSAWSACSVSCGGGTQSRTNDCGTTETQSCNTQPCCDPNLWGAWSACSVSCAGGTQSRTNDCGTTETQACNTQPCPTPYPTVAVSGNLREYLRGACFNNISTSNISININPQSPTSVTTSCGITPPSGQTRSSYRCTAVFDNFSNELNHPFPTPAQNLNLSSSASGYSSSYWTDANACTQTANNSLAVGVSSGGSTTCYN